MKWIWIIIVLVSSSGIRAQTEEGEKALNQVLDILKRQEAHLPIDAIEKLESGAWEALTYLNEKTNEYQIADLLEAVPDYYNFREGRLILKLINPKNYNEYGLELKLDYQLEGNIIKVSSGDGKKQDSWAMLYLDENYMALDMGEIRVFFTHAPVQE